ncbi:arginine--tRNA ligase [Actinomadura geliboluensis]|uniref:arginine--tRNA ligase n=1 Tax=Actinomadura geliboluensis TaxID=882440 RepID=UPI00371E73B4
MAAVVPVAVEVETRLRAAFTQVLPADRRETDPQVRRSDHADLQANGLLAAARDTGRTPRDLAAQVAAALDTTDLIASCAASGPGFVNVVVADRALLRQVARRLNAPQLGVPRSEGGVTVIDYSQPNVAKEMHVGHLRSTVIGDALARILGFLGEQVIRHNHLGDWGTQFGMLIQYQAEQPAQSAADHEGAQTTPATGLSRLNRLYRASRARFDTDPEFADRARQRVVDLQSGDPATTALWQDIVAESKVYFKQVYDRLGVLLTDQDAVGESFYNGFLDEIADELHKTGVAQISDGALCVFFDDITGPDGEPTPLIIRKKDGGYGYAATDLAALRYRIHTLGAHRILYVVDARQSLHFKQVFQTARRAGWLDESTHAVHVAFGSVLGKDGKPFKTRAGDTVRLIELLDQAVDRARAVVAEKSGVQDLEAVATLVGTGAVKYADLATSRGKDYVFDLDRMVTLNGHTGVYLQYAHARTCSILRKAGAQMLQGATLHPEIPLEPAERALALKLDDFHASLSEVAATYEPHRLCAYLFSLAQDFTTFFEQCPVLKAPAPTRDNRLLLCELTARTLSTGLNLLGLAAPDRL